jgi:hypothetical protein
MSLDICFSDHNMSKDTLKEFGEVVRAIHQVCEDNELCFCSFIYYVATHHEGILGVSWSLEQTERCAGVLARAKLPPVVVRDSERRQMLRDLQQGDSPGTGS